MILFQSDSPIKRDTILHQYQIQDFIIDAAQFHPILSSMEMKLDGNWNQASLQTHASATKILLEAIAPRMERGDFIVLAAEEFLDVSHFLIMSNQYRYETFFIDANQVSLKAKGGYLPNIPLKKQPLPHGISRITNLDTVIRYSVRDFSHYKAIHHIGDIHGSYRELKAYFQKDIAKNELYIFTGDYINRGIDSVGVLRFLMSIMHRKNVIFLEGNHETSLFNWVNFNSSHIPDFNNQTRYELEKANISRSDVRFFLKKLQEGIIYQYQEKTIIVTHGGLPIVPRNLTLISSRQLINGVGTPMDNIDTYFDNHNQGTNLYQIHGHRNYHGHQFHHNAHSFNLEGGVEKGGELRILVLDKEGFHPISIPSFT
jgi:hypothetical protein